MLHIYILLELLIEYVIYFVIFVFWKGIKTVERVVIAEKEKEKKKAKENGDKKKYRLLVEGLVCFNFKLDYTRVLHLSNMQLILDSLVLLFVFPFSMQTLIMCLS